ncbi:MAG: dihydroorotate dehydrogenase electron transfer subunit [Clostridia bacterium]|nr:dihydroorotate dehydrogenase electron transfer subunit [Oscillospiraceae bacterium]MDY5626472.1 dihydroorotate dehydrogenase electron transfer subunit [Clostridia bacterium]
MKREIFMIEANKKIAKDVYEMTLFGDTSEISAPGQFVNILIDGLFLRRPISICDCDGESLKLIYKKVGEGTNKLTQYGHGKYLDLLLPLGNGYDISKGENSVVIGGGVGVPPMYMLCKSLLRDGKNPVVILGFNTKADVFYEDEFKKLGVKTIVATANGSYGKKGFVTDALEDVKAYSYFYACGPEPMLKAVCDKTKTSGQLSFEERMGCGFGACMGCSCKTKYGAKRICKDGPVLEKEEIIW